MIHHAPGIAATLLGLTGICLISACQTANEDGETSGPAATHPVPGTRPASLPPLPDLNPQSRGALGADSPPPLPLHRQPPPLPEQGQVAPPPLPANRTAGNRPPPLPAAMNLASPDEMLHVRQARIMDHQGFEQSMAAMHLLLPAGWTDQGQVIWQPHNQCQVEVRQFQWQTRSADGNESFEFLPGIGWESSSFSSNHVRCRQLGFSSTRQYLEALARQRHPGARVLGYESLEKELADINRQFQQNFSFQLEGFSSRMWIDGGTLAISFNENGREFHEQLIALVAFQQIDMQGGMRALHAYSPAPMGMAYRFPAGQSNPLHMSLIGESMRPDPVWNRRVEEVEARIRGEAIRGMNERHQINMDTIAHLGNLSRASYNSRIGAMDRGSEQFSQTIRGVQTWTHPSAGGESFELPMDYGNAWRLNDGSFILTNNPDFHPWNDLRLSGDRLERAR